jgi:hypothetical protein
MGTAGQLDNRRDKRQCDLVTSLNCPLPELLPTATVFEHPSNHHNKQLSQATSNHQAFTTTDSACPRRRATMNSHAQGYGPYFHCIQGRLFLTVEVRSPPINPSPAIGLQENIRALIGETLFRCPSQQGPSAPPLTGAPPLASQPGLDPNLIWSGPLASPPQNYPMTEWVLDPSMLPLPDEVPVFSQQLSAAVDQSLLDPVSIPNRGPWDVPPMADPWTPIPDEAFALSPASPRTIDPRNTTPTSEDVPHHTHVAASPFSCPLCPSGHNAKRTLHRHLWVKHREYARENNIPSEEEECPVCHRIMRKDNLKRHVDTHHKRGGA